MIKEGKFGTQEAIWLTTIAISTKVFFSSPSIVASKAGTAGWYMTLISALVALCGFLIICSLLKRFPERDLTDIFDEALGRWMGFAFSGILATQLLFLSFTRIAEFTEVIKVYVFPLSPNWFITGIFVVCVFSLCILGLESMARFSKMIVYAILAGFVLVLVLGAQNYRVNYLYPIFGYGLDKTVLNGVVRSSAYGEVIILAIFARSLQGVSQIKKEGTISLILSAILISVSLLTFALTFPHFTSQEITAPMYEMATLIDYGRYLQRVEPIFLFIWIMSALMAVTILFYSFVWVYCKMFRLQDQRPVIMGGIIILFSLSLMHKSIVSIIFGNVQWSRTYGAIIAFVLPLITLVVAIIRRKGDNAHA